MSRHTTAQFLAYVEGRLTPGERARVERHLAVCSACRAEVDDLRRLADTLSAVPVALEALSSGRTRKWSAVWARVAGSPLPRNDRRGWTLRPHWQVAGAMALVALAMISTSIFVSPIQTGAFAASGPAVAVIQTPAMQTIGLTGAPGDVTLTAAVNSTATNTLGPGQTPAPIPTGWKIISNPQSLISDP